MSENHNHPDLHFQVTPMKKVLISVDYDPTAKQIAEKGYSLAKAMGAEAILLHIIADNTYYSSLQYSPIMGFDSFSNTDFFQMINVDGLKKASHYYLNKLKHHLGDESIQTMVAEGEFAEVILSTAKELHVGAIVMGSHSRRWLEQILLGSVTEKVLHNTTIPLFIIPTKERK
jgi:nucleotide-binding universal stress UspA family protein